MLVPFAIGCDGIGQFGAPITQPRARECEGELIREAVREIARLGAVFVHTAVEPGSVLEATLVKAGFSAGSLMLDMSMPAPLAAPPAEGRWISYDTSRRKLFARAVRGTLEGSRDAVEVPVCADDEAMMKAFEERGDWLGEDFALFEQDTAPAGVILLVMAGDALEIVYLGVLPTYRGRGIGKALGRRALTRAVARGAHRLNVTVDSANAPALTIYRRMGFSERRAVRIYYAAKKIF